MNRHVNSVHSLIKVVIPAAIPQSIEAPVTPLMVWEELSTLRSVRMIEAVDCVGLLTH